MFRKAFRRPKEEVERIQPVQPRPVPPAVMHATFVTPIEEKIGLFELSKQDAEKTVDVVAVHGLQGHAYKTWERDNESLWLRDFLPADIAFARILTFGYDSTVAFSSSVTQLEDRALELLNRLSAKRSGVTCPGSKARPIVFICHSFGGIVVKKAIILAHERSTDPEYKDVLDNTKAIAFLSVPHKGSNSAWWADFAASALKGASVGRLTNTELVANLRRDASVLTNVSKQFVDRARSLKIYTFYETQKLYGVLVVNEASSRIGLSNEKLFPVHADHRSICKISSKASQEYEAVGFWIVRLTKTSVEAEPSAFSSFVEPARPHPNSNYNSHSLPVIAHAQGTARAPEYLPFVVAMPACRYNKSGDCMSFDNLHNPAASRLHEIDDRTDLVSRLTAVIPPRPNKSRETRWRLYIYCAPCLDLVDAALTICGRQGVVRIDDRLQANCYHSQDGLAKLSTYKKFLQRIEDRRAGKTDDRNWYTSYIDIAWLQQRIFSRSQHSSTEHANMQPFFDLANDDLRCSTIIVLTASDCCDKLISSAPVSSSFESIVGGTIYQLEYWPDCTWIEHSLGRAS